MSKVAPPPGLRTTFEEDPSATRIVLIRHGEADVNVSGVIGGHRGCSGLTQRGQSQVHALAQRLVHSRELDAATVLVSSELARAKETAAILKVALPRVGDVEIDCELCELHPGVADGLTWDELLERYGAADWRGDPTIPFAPEGESWVGFVERVGAGLEALALRHQSSTIVVATHAGVIEASILSLLMRSPDQRMGLSTKHASMTEWERSDRGWRLLRYNDAYVAD